MCVCVCIYNNITTMITTFLALICKHNTLRVLACFSEHGTLRVLACFSQRNAQLITFFTRYLTGTKRC